MNEQYDYDLICIGSGPSGQRAAVQAAKLGKRVAVIEKGRVTGGVCIETGTIPSKTFREAVVALTAEHPSDFGMSQNGRPTAAQLAARVAHVVNVEADLIEDQLARNDVKLIRGIASFADPHTLTIDTPLGSQKLTADHILIAVGTEPTPPPDVEGSKGVIVTSDDVWRIEKLPRTLAVVGAGVIGIEYASIFAKLGIEVTLIDRRDRPLEFLDEEIVDELIHQMRDRNVTFRMDEEVKTIDLTHEPHPRAAIMLESGKRIITDVALFSIGRQGAVARLNLSAAGLTADDRGRLSVNEAFQTDVPHIYAAGDIIGYPSLAATSSEQGRRAACFAFEHHARPMEAHFPVGIYSIPEISMVGKPEHELTDAKVPYEVGVARYREIARGQILGDNSGLVKLLFHRETRKLLAVHAIGTGATELIHIGQAVIALDGGLDYFLTTVFNYPTLAECYKVAAFDALNKLTL